MTCVTERWLETMVSGDPAVSFELCPRYFTVPVAAPNRAIPAVQANGVSTSGLHLARVTLNPVWMVNYCCWVQSALG